jgi:acetyl esterase/lipase
VTTFIDEVDTLDHPIRIFHGGADEAAATCAPYAERPKKAGKDVEFMEFPGLHHGFAEPVGRGVIAQAQSRKNCRLEERAGGALINLATGQPFTWTDACVSRGSVTFESNAAARAQTAASIRAVLARRFQVQ